MPIVEFVGGLVLSMAFLGGFIGLAFTLRWMANRFTEETQGGPRKGPEVVRGYALATLTEAKQDLEMNAPPASVEPRTMFLGGLMLPRTEETNNCIFMGSTGAGKTISAEAEMYIQLRRIANPIGAEKVGGVVLDTKKENAPVVAGIVGEENLIFLSPFDERGVAPDLAKMYDREARVHQLVAVYVPGVPGKEKDDQIFWVNACRDNIGAVTMVFNERAPGRWEARDQIEATASIARIAFVLRQSVQTRQLIDTYLTNDVLSRNILASLRSYLKDWRPVAAIWSRTTRKIHFGEFVKDLGSVLILQLDTEKWTTSRAVQRLFFQRILEYSLDLPSSKLRRLFFYLDEIQQLGRIELLNSALATGRSRGLSFTWCTQTIDGLLEVYGPHVTEQMLDNISAFGFFAANGNTAEWMSKRLGKMEIKRLVDSVDLTQGSHKTRTPQFQVTDVAIPSEITGIRPPSRERGIQGIYGNRLTRRFYSTLMELDRILPTPNYNVPEFKPRPASDEVLEPWTMDDLRRLNLEVGPDDDLEALLGPQPDPGPPPPEVLEQNTQPEIDKETLFNKLGSFFWRGVDR